MCVAFTYTIKSVQSMISDLKIRIEIVLRVLHLGRGFLQSRIRDCVVRDARCVITQNLKP
jgi:hypothetical protein